MIKFRDRVGEVIGRLTITSRANDAYKNKIQWNCICECGYSISHQTNNERFSLV